MAPKLDPSSILVIDDFDHIRSHLVNQLHEVGFDVVLESHSPKQALAEIRDLYHKHKFQAILCDLHSTGGLSGEGLFKALQLDPVLKKLPFILLGDKRDLGKMAVLLRQGIFDFLLKPFDAKDIKQKFTKLLRKSLKEKGAYSHVG